MTGPKSLESRLSGLHARARATPALHRLAVISRILLALAFVPSSIVKVMGQRFTSISASTPIGYFFEALYQSGAYWRFLGLAQLVSAILLLIPKTSTLGAVLCFPIILNIFIITVSLHFTGTPVITGLMLLASLFLVCWDYHRVAPLLFGRMPSTALRTVTFSQLERAGFALGTLSSLGVLMSTRGIGGNAWQRSVIVTCLVCTAVAGVMVVVSWVRASRTARRASDGPRAAA
jgi:hypothetical protein